MKVYLFSLIFLLAGCASTQNNQQVVNTNESQAIPLSKKVYFFQHKVLPEWTFTTEGRFYTDLLKNDLTKLKQAAMEIVSADYAAELKSKVINKNAVLITFPTPKMFPNCFYVLIKKNQQGFAFYTYEKTMSLGKEDKVKGVVGTWSEEGAHGNLGGRAYTSENDFVDDILGKEKKVN